MRIGAVVLTRLDSSRLPGKALANVNGRPLLWYCLERLKRSRLLDSIVIATTDRPVDGPINDYARRDGFQVFRGSSHDVARRFLKAGISYDFDAIARINADCPLLDVCLLDRACKIMRENNFDVVTNILPRSFPFGIVVEIVRTKVFLQGYRRMSKSTDFEHVTKHFYEQEKIYRIKNIINQYKGERRMLDYRFTVDTLDQLQAFRRFVDSRENAWGAVTLEEGLLFGGFGE